MEPTWYSFRGMINETLLYKRALVRLRGRKLVSEAWFGLHSLCDPFWAHFSFSGFLSSPMK